MEKQILVSQKGMLYWITLSCFPCSDGNLFGDDSNEYPRSKHYKYGSSVEIEKNKTKIPAIST